MDNMICYVITYIQFGEQIYSATMFPPSLFSMSLPQRLLLALLLAGLVVRVAAWAVCA
ncbi:MAG: hypothetical protein P4M13_01685 [Alphaproteobacteria bacterium]|nr:hypothetical protein [Alphaproteobacteria bacterium]